MLVILIQKIPPKLAPLRHSGQPLKFKLRVLSSPKLIISLRADPNEILPQWNGGSPDQNSLLLNFDCRLAILEVPDLKNRQSSLGYRQSFLHCKWIINSRSTENEEEPHFLNQAQAGLPNNDFQIIRAIRSIRG